jgi:nitroimidazol reductase NimA-like FMN-containing flavoprotein (pyridoxamine 5'-phosphate oxidase superfamily)
MINDLSQDKARELLRRGRLARLACIADGEPYIVPVNYVFDGENVLIHSLPGHKITAMRANPRVCLQLDEVENEMSWKSVLVFGDYEEITDGAERSRAMSHLLSHFPQLTPVESRIVEDAGAPAPIVFRIKVNRITGLSEGN